MASVSSLGLGSNINAEEIVTNLVTLEKQPITTLETTNSTLQSKVSAWGNLQSLMSTLKDAATALTKPTAWSPTTATSSDTSAVTLTTSADTKPGSYTVKVEKLAASQYVASSAFTASSATVGEGTLRIELGTWNTDQTGFTAKSGATAVDVTIDADDTLEDIASKINSANSGVTASIVNDASGARLVMKGATGEENAFRVTATDGDGNDSDAAGLSALAFDPSSGLNNLTQTQAAVNAKIKINGLDVSSASNTLNNVVDGLTINLGKVTTSDVSVNVAQDNATITKSIDSFVAAYNAVVSAIRTQTAYDAETKTAGTLQGDSSATGLLSQLRSLMGSESGASSVFSRLPSIGLDIQLDGTIKADSKKFSEALSKNTAEVQKLFANADSAEAGNNGIAERFRLLTTSVLGTEGTIATRTDGLKSTIKRNENKIEGMETRVDLYEKRLRAQYTALDTSMSQLNALSSYVTNMIAALNNSNSSS